MIEHKLKIVGNGATPKKLFGFDLPLTINELVEADLLI